MPYHRLSTKLPSTLKNFRMSATSDLFLIVEFYDNVEVKIVRLDIINKPVCIWNLDKTDLYTCSMKSKVIAPVVQKTARGNANSGHESLSVLACISTNGNFAIP